MKLSNIIVGALAFSVWRGYRGMRKNVRQNAKRGLRRMEKAI